MMKRLLIVIVSALVLVPTALAQPSLHVGSHGKGVCAAEYLLHREHVRNPKRGFAVHTLRHADCYFGPKTRTATRAAYWKLGWPAWYVKSPAGGRYGPRLRSTLLGLKARPLDYRITAGKRAYAARKRLREHAQITTRDRRLVANANYLIRVGWRVHYSQAIRMTIVRRPIRHFPFAFAIYEDCSSSVTGLYFVTGGYPDPNGAIGGHWWSGWGFTGTLANNGRVVWQRGQSLDRLRIGDLILYGRYPYHHVTMYLGGGRAFSQGKESGPYALPVLYRSDATQARRYVPSGVQTRRP